MPIRIANRQWDKFTLCVIHLNWIVCKTLLFLNSGDEDSGKIFIFDDLEEEKKLVKTLEIHSCSVRFILFNKVFNLCISIDRRGFIELWDPNTFDFPKSSKLNFKVKIETDLFELVKRKAAPTGACLSPNGHYLAI